MKNHTAIEPLETRIAPATVFAVSDNNTLFSFDSEAPGTLSAGIPITGLGGGEIVKAMDFRPATGELYAVTISGAAAPFTGRLYTIDTTTGAATAVGAGPFSATLNSGTGIGMDFNPTADRIRFTTDTDLNLRINPDDAAVTTDTNITVANLVAGVAYTNNYPGATATTLYAIDYINDDLFTIGGLNSIPSPNDGVGVKVANINVTTTGNTRDRLGLDIHTTLEGNTAYYTGVVGAQNLYTLNLATGAATLVGAIGNGTTPIFDIAVQPAAALTFPDGKSFTYTDGDGDLVTVKTSVGTLKSSQFGWLASADGTRRELTVMNISSDATFTGANLTITAKKTATGGDGRVEVGTIFANGVNLGAVKIGGHVEHFDAGTSDAVIPAVKSFDAFSLGRILGAAGGDFISSEFLGPVPVFKVKTDITGTAVFITGKVGTFSVGGSIIGGDGNESGRVQIGAGAKSVTIGGSLIGGDGTNSGRLVLGPTGLLKIGGNILGGSGEDSGSIENLSTSAKTVIIGGSILGGSGKDSGRVTTGEGDTVKISGSVIGGDGENSALVSIGAKKTVTIGGSIVGGDGNYAGGVAATKTAIVKLAGSVIGGKGFTAGFLSAGDTKSVFVGGSVDATHAVSLLSGLVSFFSAKTVAVKGGLIGSPEVPAVIAALGHSTPPTNAAESIVLGSLTIGGSVIHGQIRIGGVPGLGADVNVGVGKITIGGDFLASSIAAGFDVGTDGNFGTADDAPAAMNTLPDIKAAIASITIKGRASGTGSDGDHYGIVAEQLGTVSIAGRKLTLDPAAQDNVLVGAFADFRIRELAIP